MRDGERAGRGLVCVACRSRIREWILCGCGFGGGSFSVHLVPKSVIKSYEACRGRGLFAGIE
jgi:hypothetical protein